VRLEVFEVRFGHWSFLRTMSSSPFHAEEPTGEEVRGIADIMQNAMMNSQHPRCRRPHLHAVNFEDPRLREEKEELMRFFASSPEEAGAEASNNKTGRSLHASGGAPRSPRPRLHAVHFPDTGVPVSA